MNSGSQKFLRNVKTILHYRKENIGEFERSIGKCTGWMSRAELAGSSITLDAAFEIAAKLKMPFEDIMDRDWETEFKRAEIQDELNALEQRRRALQAELESV